MEKRLRAVLAADMVGFSRLIEADETATLARQKHLRHSLIDPAIAEANGSVIKQTGDGLIAAFSGAGDAVRCAIQIQTAMQTAETDAPQDRLIAYRIGINVGDIVYDEGDVFGDGVNVAARLEAMAEPGGVCVSDAVYQMVQVAMDAPFVDLGAQKVKNISRPIRVWQWTPDGPGAPTETPQTAQDQQVSFCISGDGAQLAWAKVGQGPAVLKAPNWLNHLDYEWRSPIWGPVWAQMARHCTLVRFDQRGNGLSDWDPPDVSEDTMIADMNRVAEAAGIDRFYLFALSQGCAFSIRYAVEHPDKVAGLVLVSGYVRGAMARNAPDQAALHAASNTLIRQGWGSPNPAFRSLFTESMMPDASTEQKSGFDELQRVATSPEMAARINEMNGDVDVSALAPQVRAPTLVLHCEGDKRVPIAEGRRMAALIPGATFVTLPGNNHALVDGSPALAQTMGALAGFLRDHPIT